MRRVTRLLPSPLLAWLMFLVLPATSLADTPLPFEMRLAWGDARPLGYLILGCFVATLLVEYPVVYWMIGRPKKARTQLLFWLALINMVTNPAVQIALLYLEPALEGWERFGWLYLCVIELAVVAVEFWLFTRVFARMYRGRALDEPVTTTWALVAAIAANLASFVIGGIGVRAVVALAYGVPLFWSGW